MSALMGFYAELERSTKTLTAAERRIGALLLADPRGAPFLRAADLAKLADVHESTVIRFAQKLGYAGYVEMKDALREDSVFATDHTIAMRDGGEAFSLAMVVTSQVDVLRRLPEKISQERIDACAEAILSADRVFVLGRGLVLPLVDFMTNKLARIGIPAVTVTGHNVDRATALAAVRPRDTVVVFALNDEFETMAAQLRTVAKDGAKVVLLTDEDSLMSSDLPQQVIAIPRDRARHGVLVAMTAICYAIHYALVHCAAERLRDTRARVDELATLDPTHLIT
ncbi:hypothetical protein Aple_001440 [Acrocarpospora pleiomorpha]|uniref:RpiR family transcriptional regulator n=1 Tax=Acrocarpospora pleiomorpha TaxID=90975 RepID=A0A5M3XAM1_9ACTN|nr:MurR/RpiR family transcriptional regulator [Acrocarpospora pleiomorpha]GES17249.1 hypothetical protein Aple_001440 [Acrocarpospora pleiomorpha]